MHLAAPSLELLGAQRMTDVLNGVTQAVSEVIGGVYAPGVPGVGVGGVLHPVGHGIHLAVLHDVLHAESSLRKGWLEVCVEHTHARTCIIYNVTCNTLAKYIQNEKH